MNRERQLIKEIERLKEIPNYEEQPDYVLLKAELKGYNLFKKELNQKVKKLKEEVINNCKYIYASGEIDCGNHKCPFYEGTLEKSWCCNLKKLIDKIFKESD